MPARIKTLWTETDGVLSFEWILLLTLLTIGIVGGIAAARDAIIDELGDVAEAAQAIDQSFSLAGIEIEDVFVTPDSVYTETAADAVVSDCTRTPALAGQADQSDSDS
jgi:hypothetical protein